MRIVKAGATENFRNKVHGCNQQELFFRKSDTILMPENWRPGDWQETVFAIAKGNPEIRAYLEAGFQAALDALKRKAAEKI